MSPTTGKDQLALDEKVVENDDLEALLDRRMAAKDRLGQLRAEFDQIDREARAMIDGLDLGVDTAIRVGKYRISRTMTTARAVSFETEAKERVSIGVVEDAE